MSCIASSVLVLFASTAAAQTPTPPPQKPPVVKETVEVVATRLPEAPHEVPAALEVISGDDLRDRGALTLRDALSLAAGVEIAPGGDGGPAGSVPEFWGLREFDAFLLVVDGVPWGGAFNPALTTLSLRDVERVEILRGAAPVTYGATSFVGVIHVVHKAAAASRNYFDARAGSFGGGGLAADLVIPSASAWKSRLSVDFDHQGFRDDRTSFGRGHAMWRTAKVDGDRKTWFTADLSALRQHPASPHPRQDAALSAAVPLDANANPANAFLDENRIALAFGFARPMMKDVAWDTTVSFTHSGQQIFRGFLTDIANVANNAAGLRENIDVNDLYVDSHGIWPVRSHVQLLGGADFLHGNGDAKGATFAYTAPLTGIPVPSVTEPTNLPLGSEDRREFFGAYGLAEWKPTPKVHVSGGVRLNITFEERGENETAAAQAAGEKDEGQTHVRPSASIGASLTAWEQGANHVRIYGNYRNTFKPAAFDFGIGQAEVEGEGLLKPETAQSFEGGTKIQAMDGRASFEASVFRMDFHNLVTATVANGLPALMNAGQTRFQGFEMAADLRLPRQITGRATYSFHDGKFVDFVQAFGGVPTQLAGKRFEMSARQLFSVGAGVAPERGSVAHVVVKYTGDRYLNKRNTALAAGYATVDCGFGYRFERWEVRVDGRNLGDRRDPVAESELGDAQYYRMTSRRFDLGFGVRF